MRDRQGAAARLAAQFALALTAGCVAAGDPPHRQTFLVQLDVAVSGGRAPLRRTEAVYVAPVLVAAPYSGRNLVVRQSDLGFAADPYAEFAANPVSMWTDALRSWLDARQLFERVLPLGSSAEAGLTLETNLLEAVVDRRAGQPPSSRVMVRFLLVQNQAPHRVLLDRTFGRTEPVRGAGPEHEVAALSLAFEGSLHDLQDAVARIPDPASPSSR